MKLATALSERSNLQTKISELQNRLNNNAKVQEGEQPAEEPVELLKELECCLKNLEDLMVKINLTNSIAKKDGVTLTELIAKRDCLKKKLVIMRSFLDEASRTTERYSRKEIKIVSTVKVSEIQKQVDAISKQLRETDETIQELNWTTELI